MVKNKNYHIRSISDQNTIPNNPMVYLDQISMQSYHMIIPILNTLFKKITKTSAEDWKNTGQD